MPSRSHAALLAALALLGTTVGADARDSGAARRHARVLPPLSGTLRMAANEFGSPRPHRLAATSRAARRQTTVKVIRGGVDPRVSYSRVSRDGGYRAIWSGERWAAGGTGVSGLIGNTGNPYLGQARWGTADSATTGAAPDTAWQRRGLFTAGFDAPLTQRYGERPLYAGIAYDEPANGAAPSLPFYGSGAPVSSAYYSSGSSAGPYGSPGGLGVYRSGSYGYGARHIAIDAGDRQGSCTCGPRILHLRRHPG